ncbi:hypothetical protein A2Y83_02180 [Candidatus Falkowbacteria bacterium RBG_13_39_14]|uniref:Uncharacterized protein n=1 Tax=Candidatus Falkowbacteria bacterium RBG_13_39_14 TaxID=1797985 RepID=A0A1F5S3V7_9BACT|nr:MAG: hypothetical protein A2Y83_02180 [Candidatus Falkowbacteria bacterium RBG_13_39_14]
MLINGLSPKYHFASFLRNEERNPAILRDRLFRVTTAKKSLVWQQFEETAPSAVKCLCSG